MGEMVHSITPQLSKEQLTNLSTSKSKLSDLSTVHNLIREFIKVDNQIQINPNNVLSGLFTSKQSKQSKKDSVAAKLQKLENAAVMNRAQLEMRSRQKHHKLAFQRRRNTQVKNINYMQTYKQYLKQKQKQINQSQFEEDQQKLQEIIIENEPGKLKLKYKKQLNKHPKIINFIMNETYSQKQIKERQKNKNTIMQRQNIKKLHRENLSQQFTEICKYQKQSRAQSNDPEEVITQQLPKFYSQRSNHKINPSLLKSARCSNIVQQQNDILKSTQNLSKDNIKKLKFRFAQIVNDIGKIDKKIINKRNINNRYQKQK